MTITILGLIVLCFWIYNIIKIHMIKKNVEAKYEKLALMIQKYEVALYGNRDDVKSFYPDENSIRIRIDTEILSSMRNRGWFDA